MRPAAIRPGSDRVRVYARRGKDHRDRGAGAGSPGAHTCLIPKIVVTLTQDITTVVMGVLGLASTISTTLVPAQTALAAALSE